MIERSSSLEADTVSSIEHAVTSQAPKFNQEIIRCLSSLTACKSARNLQVIQSSSHTAALLSAIMPEMDDGQHLTTSESLCHPRQTQLEEAVRVCLFLLSNNFTLGSGGQEDHELIMGILRTSGLNSLQAIKELFSTAGATAEAIAERLFKSALRSCDMEVIQLMMKAGMDLNTITHDDIIAVTPLEFAAEIPNETVSMKMTRMLLSFKADVNEYAQELALYFATCRGHANLMKILISNGARVTPSSLHKTIYLDDPTLLEILEHGMTPQEEHPCEKGSIVDIIDTYFH